MRKLRSMLLIVALVALAATPAIAFAADPVPVTTAWSWSSQNADGSYYDTVWVSIRATLDWPDPFPPQVTTECSVDRGPWEPVAMGWVTISGSGTHTLEYRSKYLTSAMVEVIEPTQSMTFVIRTKPAFETVWHLVGPVAPNGEPLVGTSVTLETSPTPAPATMQTLYSLDGVTYDIYEPGVTRIAFLQAGMQSVWYYSTDLATGETEAPQMISFDVPGPPSYETSVTVQGSRDWSGAYAPGARVSLETSPTPPNPADFQIYYSVDGVTFQPYVAGETTLVYDTVGAYDLWYYSVNTVTGATEETKQFRIVISETVQPVTVPIVSGVQNEDGTYQAPVQVSFAPNPAGQVTYYSFDGWNFQPYETVGPYPTTISFSTPGPHTLWFYTLDWGTGVFEPTRQLTITIEGEAPSLHTNATVNGTLGTDGKYLPGAWVGLDAGVSMPNTQYITYWSLDGVMWGIYDPMFTNIAFWTPGTYTLSYYTTDIVNNVTEPMHQLTIEVGATSGTEPQTTAIVSGTLEPDGTYSSIVTITLQATGGGGPWALETYYSYDGTYWERYYPGMSVVTFWTGGTHTLWYYTRDPWTGATEPVQQLTVTVRDMPPTTSALVSGNWAGESTYSGPVHVEFWAYPAGEGWDITTWYSFDEQATWTPIAPFTYFTVADPGTYTVWYYSVDNATGMVEAVQSKTFTVLAGPPVTTAELSGDKDESGYYVSPVTVTLSAQPSGDDPVAYTEYSLDWGWNWQTYTGPFTVEQEGTTYVLYRSAGTSGGLEQYQATSFDIIFPRPVTTASFSGDAGEWGWYRSPVTVTLTAQGTESDPVASTEYSLDWGWTWQTYTGPFTVEQEGWSQLMYRSVSVAGRTEFDQYSSLQIDTSAPVFNVYSPTEGQTFVLGSWAYADWYAYDDASGVSSSWGDVYPWMPLDTSSAGSKTLELGARDYAGNEGTASVTYQVVYGWNGFEPTINADGSSTFRIGPAVPIRFKLCDAGGQPVSGAVAKLTVTKISETITGTTWMPVFKGKPSSGDTFTYDETTQTYGFDWDTRHNKKGTYEAVVTLDDGTTRSITFSLR